MTTPRKLAVDLREGEVLSIEGGRILLKVEKKYGRQARLVFELRSHIPVVRLSAGGQIEKLGEAPGPV
jgi:hypothetical protein